MFLFMSDLTILLRKDCRPKRCDVQLFKSLPTSPSIRSTPFESKSFAGVNSVRQIRVFRRVILEISGKWVYFWQVGKIPTR